MTYYDSARSCPAGHTTPVELLDGWDLVDMDAAMAEPAAAATTAACRW